MHRVKLPAGHLVLYPSTSLHHVTPVTRGARLCSFFWIQSMVRDDGERTLLFDLDRAIQRISQRSSRSSVGAGAHRRLSQPAAPVGGGLTCSAKCCSGLISSAGLFAGVVVFIMSITGVIAHLREADAGVGRSARGERSSCRLRARRAFHCDRWSSKSRSPAPKAAVTTITRRSDPQAPVTVALERRHHVLVHPSTGHVIGEAPKTMREVFRTATEWHRYLAGQGENRAVGQGRHRRLQSRVSVLVLSGLLSLAAAAMDRRGGDVPIGVPRWRHATGKARDFNWHNALGIVDRVPLAIVVASATVISYPWASDLAYRVVGEAPPPRPAGPPGGGPGGLGAGRPGGGVGAGAPRAAQGDRQRQTIANLEAHWQTAEAKVGEWRTVALRLPANANAPLVFTIDEGYGGQPQHRGTLTIDQQSGAATGWETFAEQSPGRRFESTLRFAHTGEFWGIPGQTVAGVVSAAACVLVWTGFALAWRRFSAWRQRRVRQPLERAA